jgi:hypothetical protein
MGIFKDIKIGWNDEKKVLPEKKVMPLIKRINDIHPIHQILGGAPDVFKLIECYAEVLKACGFDLPSDEKELEDKLYLDLFDNDAGSNYTQTVEMLRMLIIPPKSIAVPAESEEEAKKK